MIKVLRFGVALVAGVLAASTSACSGSGPGSGPALTGLTSQWTVNHTGGTFDQGAWFIDGKMVTGTYKGLTALSLRTGHTEWSWSLPAPPSGDYVGADMSNEADGVGLVTYSYLSQASNTTANAPEYMAGINLSNGHAIWTRTIKASLNVENPGYRLGDGVIAEIAENGSSNVAYVAAATLATGKPAWSDESDPQLRGCSFSGLAFSGALLYGVATCSGSFVVYGLSVRTGAVESKVTLDNHACATNTNMATDGYSKPTLWAASGYLLVGCSEPELPRNYLVLLRPGSSHQSIVTYSSTVPSFEYNPYGIPGFAPFIITGTRLYISAKDSSYNDAIDAISLASGRQLWQRDTPGYGYMVGADKSGVMIVIKNAGSGNSAQASVSLAAMSAQSGAISYGPGTMFNFPAPDSYSLTLVDHTLIAADEKPLNSPITAYGAPLDSPIIAYNTGAWPN